jgi:hypothetical protein
MDVSLLHSTVRFGSGAGPRFVNVRKSETPFSYHRPSVSPAAESERCSLDRAKADYILVFARTILHEFMTKIINYFLQLLFGFYLVLTNRSA